MITAQVLSQRLKDEYGIELYDGAAEQIIQAYELVSKEMKKSDKEVVKNSCTLREKNQGFTDKDIALMKAHKLSEIKIITQSDPMLIKFYDGTEVSISGRSAAHEFRGLNTAKAIQQQFDLNPNQTLLKTLAKPIKDLSNNDVILYLFAGIAGNLADENDSIVTSEELKKITLKILTEETERQKLTYKIKSAIKRAIAYILLPFKFLGNKMVSAIKSVLQPFKYLFNKMFGAKKDSQTSVARVSIAPLRAGDLQSVYSGHTTDNESVSSPSVARTIDLNIDSSNDDVFAPAVGTQSTRPSV